LTCETKTANGKWVLPGARNPISAKTTQILLNVYEIDLAIIHTQKVHSEA
jgi:hypothetical protein